MTRPLITCRELIEFIAGYVDGELDDVSRGDFEKHLARCPSCRAYLETYQTTRHLVQSLATDEPVEDVPEELVQSILSRRHG